MAQLSSEAEVGERIRARRKARGWTQLELGSRLRPAVTHAAISDIERGKCRLGISRLRQIARVLGTTDGDLVLGLQVKVAEQVRTYYDWAPEGCYA